MAQHIEIGKAGFDILFKIIDPEPFRDNPYYKRVSFQGGKIYLAQNISGSGLLRSTEYILCFEPKDMNEPTYEIHFNYRNKVLKVYSVM